MNLPININSITLPNNVGGVNLPQNLNQLREQLPADLTGARLEGINGGPQRIDMGPERMGPLGPRVSGVSGGESFGSMVNRAIQSVDASMKEADKSGQDFIAGRTDNVHDVMINMQRAQLSFQMLVEVRNKAIEAYQELSRMQI
ncbi:MAG: flagellar hook-basal body complex protein FliE [Bacteroidetes bacterium]|nr:flagellar hook-basal body complex protein FliE [Bacteroidota bacterium]MCH8523836.1 flagellar hook-basal body complex protein FliE [Balneolales bacterium]